MTFKLSLRQKIAALGVAGAVVLGTGGAVAWAQSGGASPSTTAPAAARARSDVPVKALRPLARRAVHGDVVVKAKDGSFVTVTFDRGTVTAASDTSVTLQRPDNQSVTLTVNGDTKVHGAASAAALQTGKDAVVISKSGTATQILQRG
ncbi:MAG TPA: hypothetical protein VKD67_13615 [Acidimicrobiales bacterium]|nr:hypothetical protein [Acidimicrobiales bacterium]